MAFQAGARHALSELIENLGDLDAATAIALRLNDEIRDFATAALKMEPRQ